jgi:hypothetical protein
VPSVSSTHLDRDARTNRPRERLERLLVLAVVEIMESRAHAERAIARYARRMNRGSES